MLSVSRPHRARKPSPATFQDLLFLIDDATGEPDFDALHQLADQVVRLPRQWEIFNQNIARRREELGYEPI